MSNDYKEPLETGMEVAEQPAKLHKPYSKPILEELGDLRSLTLGGSPGVNDSGGGFQIENFPF